MAEPRSTMIDPPIEVLLDKVDSKFTLVTLAAKRGRQVNSYFSQLGEGLGAIVPPQVASIARKPLSIALEEIAAGKVVAVWPVRGGSRRGRGRRRRADGEAPETGRPARPSPATAPAMVTTAVSDAATRRRRGRPSRPVPRPAGVGRARRGATVVLGVSGGIAAYKAVEICRRLVDAGAHVVPVLTADATRFVGEATFSALASEPAHVSSCSATTDPIPHTDLGRRADLVLSHRRRRA